MTERIKLLCLTLHNTPIKRIRFLMFHIFAMCRLLFNLNLRFHPKIWNFTPLTLENRFAG